MERGTGDGRRATAESAAEDLLASASARSSAEGVADPTQPTVAPRPSPVAEPSLTSERDRDVLRSFAKRIDPSDAGAHNNLGVLYYNKGLLGEAVAAFSRALELDPKMQVAQRNLEIAYFNTGYYDRRVSELKDRLRVQADDRDARWELGRTYALLGQVENAVAEFSEMLRFYPDDVGAIVQLGLAEKGSGDLETAARWFARALALDPTSAVVQFYVGEVHYNRGLNDEALNALKRSIELAPDNPDAHYLLGFVLGDMGRHDEAQKATKRAIQLNPALSRAHANLSLDRPSPQAYESVVAQRMARAVDREMAIAPEGQLAHYNLGLAFRQKGYYAEALREYRLAAERGEDAELVLQAMAEVHLLKKEPAIAAQLYDKLLASRPDSPKLWNERGIALHQDGRYADACESYRRAVTADPKYALGLNNLGVALYHTGNPEGSVEAFRFALKAQPSFVKARLNLALLLFKRKRLPLCLEAFRQVLQLEPEQPVAWNGVGLVLVELKKLEDARNAYGRAIQARPNYAEAHYNLSFVLSNLGDYEGALRATKRALEIDPYYVPQKFELAIDLEFEDPDFTIIPDLGGDKRTDGAVEEFAFDNKALDSLFTELAPVAPAPAPVTPSATPYSAAADYLSKGLLDRASAEASRVLARGADAVEGLTLLGDVYAKQGAYGEALERYRQARAAAGDGPTTTAKRALAGEVRVLIMLGRGGEARPLAEDLLGAAPNDVEMLILAATARADGGDPAAALEALERARQAAPARADVLKQVGDVARSIGDFESAMESYRHAVTLDPDFAVVRYHLATILEMKGFNLEAERELSLALDSVPTYTEAALALASLRRRLQRHGDSLALLVELLQRDPYNLDALTSLGETLFESGKRADASVAFSRVLRFDPEHVGALYFEGVLAAEQHRYREAIERWRRVVDLAPACVFARRARRDTRTAADLQRIFVAREPAA
jgi:tetratricopeptide (TPR) repeat protein